VSDIFEVGQKVKALDTDGEVVYGPVRSTFGTYTGYVVSKGGVDVWHKASDLAAIPKPPAFAVGDEVTLTTRWGGSRYTVEYGPFDDRDVYVVRSVEEPADPDDVRTFTALASVMRKVEAPAVQVGDRVRIVKDSDGYGAGKYNGLVGTLERVDEGSELAHLVRFGDGSGIHGDKVNGRWWCERVEPVTEEDTYEHSGVIYDLTAKYTDRDGDPLRIALVNGVPRAAWFGCVPGEYDDTLAEVVDEYGPLTRVTD
jgi:hypothetical protein